MRRRTGTSYEADRRTILARLRKMEGQVRGLQRMIEEDRYCLDVIQQINALTAAARGVELIVLRAHLRAFIDLARQGDGGPAVEEMLTVLRKAVR